MLYIYIYIYIYIYRERERERENMPRLVVCFHPPARRCWPIVPSNQSHAKFFSRSIWVHVQSVTKKKLSKHCVVKTFFLDGIWRRLVGGEEGGEEARDKSFHFQCPCRPRGRQRAVVQTLVSSEQ